jgi:hypothetical protein
MNHFNYAWQRSLFTYEHFNLCNKNTTSSMNLYENNERTAGRNVTMYVCLLRTLKHSLAPGVLPSCNQKYGLEEY